MYIAARYEICWNNSFDNARLIGTASFKTTDNRIKFTLYVNKGMHTCHYI